MDVGDVLLQAHGKEHGVRVDLHGPVAVPELARVKDGVPGLDKDRRVQPGAPLALLGRDVPDRRGGEAVAKVEGAVAEDRPGVAGEDAQALGHLVPDQLRLGAGGRREGPAEERRMRGPGRGAGPQRLAAPGLRVGVAGSDARGARVRAGRPPRVLLVALHAGAAAAHRVGAALPARAAPLLHPVRDRLRLHRGDAGRPGPQLRAVPVARVGVEEVGARLARLPAAGPLRGLPEARRARLPAAGRVHA
mmetsp:Transcript_69395/g.184442  ORF Transcript_69395/g.184442 Transcript_69395/m.184442 type:complete len:248 (-) Transcript_69395:827-1570(-)